MSSKRSGKKSKKSEKSNKPKRPPKPARPLSAKAQGKAARARLEGALVEVYGGLSELYFQAAPSPGSTAPIKGVWAYSQEEPRPHWAFVTHGLGTEFQLELTLRVARAADEVLPPDWPFMLLDTLGLFMIDGDGGPVPGVQVDLRGPVSLKDPTQLRAIAFVEDPLLKSRPELDFIQAMGVSGPEYEAGVNWDPLQVHALLLERLPWGITDLERECLLKTDPALRKVVQEAAEREGSSQTGMNPEEIRWKQGEAGLSLTLDAASVPMLQNLLRGRTRHGRDFVIHGATGQAVVSLVPGEDLRWAPDPKQPKTLVLTVPEPEVERLLQDLPPKRGTYAFAGWSVVVVPTVIRDEYGRVLETVG